MISIEAVAAIYVDIADLIAADFPDNHTVFPRGAKMVSKSVSTRFRHNYECVKIDFTNTNGATAAAIATAPDVQDIFSVCLIHERDAGGDELSPAARKVIIFLNTGISAKTGKNALNYCWGRYCLLKEAFQAILFEDRYSTLVKTYPSSTTFEEMSALYSQINNEPFSLWDFGDDQYSKGLQVENAAEMLAAGVLFPFELALDIQKRLTAAVGEAGLRSFSYLKIAQEYKVPQRYVELLVTWEGLEAFVGNIKRARDGLLGL